LKLDIIEINNKQWNVLFNKQVSKLVVEFEIDNRIKIAVAGKS